MSDLIAIKRELMAGLPIAGPRLAYTRRAFAMLPPLDSPRILEAGCGRGDVTLELVRLSEGRVTAVDHDAEALRELRDRADREGVGKKVVPLKLSLLGLALPEQVFDVVWAEGSVWVIGFAEGLRQWGRLLRPGGFMAIHEMAWLKDDPPAELRDYWTAFNPDIKTVAGYLKEVDDQRRMRLIGHFALPANLWRDVYYGPLEERLLYLLRRLSPDDPARAELGRQQAECRWFRSFPGYYGSAFFIFRRD